jgi:hypothetical protein
MCLAGMQPAEQLQIEDALELARLCNIMAGNCGKEHRAIRAILLASCDLLTRQHLMLRQANLVPRVEFQDQGSAH